MLVLCYMFEQSIRVFFFSVHLSPCGMGLLKSLYGVPVSTVDRTRVIVACRERRLNRTNRSMVPIHTGLLHTTVILVSLVVLSIFGVI